jgi:predicted RNase H-like nuclease/post-segregation antitoxin (ccd killing protein)
LRFVGCALAWRPGEAREKVSCLVVMDERGSIIANAFTANAEDIARSVEGYGSERRGTVVGVDAPLAVPNERGTRRIERILSKVALPAYSASRRMFGGKPFAEEFLSELEKVGVEYTDYPFPRQRDQSVVVEVDSAATLKVLSLERSGAAENGDLAQRLRGMDDPKFRKGNKEGRAAALRGAIEVLWDTPGLRLRTGNLSADLSASENVDVSKLDVSASVSHAELDRIVGLVEGTLAAYTVHRHWRGRDGSMIVGAGDEGSVLLPAKTALRERLAEECGTAGVPYV